MATTPPDQDRHSTERPAERTARPDDAELLAASLAEGKLTGQQRSAAETDLRARLRDAAPALRRAIADCLQSSPHAPRAVLLALADDHDSVSIPILEHSPVLEEADLIGLAATATTACRAAIARRRTVGPALAEALVETAEATVVATLLANHTADCPAPLLMACLDRCPTSETVHRALIGRSKLPVAVALRLVTLASDGLSQLLIARHPVSAAPDSEAVELTRNRPGWWSQQITGYFS